jgi:hypothetical protein
MKEPWCLAASDGDASALTLIKYYAKRWTIEPHLRDTKDLRFGMGLSATRIGEPTRRDRLLLVNAFAVALLTMLGAAGEALGTDRPPAEVKHVRDPHAFAVPPGLHARRPDPDHAGGKACAVDGSFR